MEIKDTDTIIINPIPPVLVPKIIEFSSSKPIYREDLKEQVILNWKIANPNQLQNLVLTQQESNGSPVQKTFIQCTPQELKTLGMQSTSSARRIQIVNNTEFLNCQGIAMNVIKAGNYTFKLEVFSKQNPKQPSDTKQTDTITIQPVSLPKIIDTVLTNKVIYEHKKPILLNWRLTNPGQIKELKIIQQASDGSSAKTTLFPGQCKTQRLALEVAKPNNQLTSNLAANSDILICEKIPIVPVKAGS